MVSPPTPFLCLGGWERLTSRLFVSMFYVVHLYCVCCMHSSLYVCNVSHMYCICCMHVLVLLISLFCIVVMLFMCIVFVVCKFWFYSFSFIIACKHKMWKAWV